MNYVFKSKSTGKTKKLVMIKHPISADQSDCYMIESSSNGKESKKSQFSGPHDFEETRHELENDPDWKLDSMAP